MVGTIVLMGACYFLFKFFRYVLDSWGPLVIEKFFGMGPVKVGLISIVFDWVGFFGVLVAGWVFDCFFAGRRYQTILLMSVGMVLVFVFLVILGL